MKYWITIIASAYGYLPRIRSPNALAWRRNPTRHDDTKNMLWPAFLSHTYRYKKGWDGFWSGNWWSYKLWDSGSRSCAYLIQEIDPTPEEGELEGLDEGSSSFFTDLAGSIPGIDEAMSFAEVMRQVFESLNELTNIWDLLIQADIALSWAVHDILLHTEAQANRDQIRGRSSLNFPTW